MSTASGARAPEVTLCPHLIQSGLNQPFALYATKRTAQYACQWCVVDLVERRLVMPGQNPAAIAESLVFTMCQHQGDNPGRACWRCLSAIIAALTIRWAESIFEDRQHANRVLRIVQLLNRHYDPARNVPRPSASPRHRPELEAGVAPVLTATEIAEQRRERKAKERIEKRNAQIRQERSLPQFGAIHREQSNLVAVVAPD